MRQTRCDALKDGVGEAGQVRIILLWKGEAGQVKRTHLREIQRSILLNIPSSQGHREN